MGRLRMVASVVVSLASLLAGCSHGEEVHTIRGVTTAVNFDSTALGVRAERAKDATAFSVGEPVRWFDTASGTENDGSVPACVPPLSDGAHIELDYVVHHGHSVVLEVRCQSLPTTIQWARGESSRDRFAAFCTAPGHDDPSIKKLDDPCTGK